MIKDLLLLITANKTIMAIIFAIQINKIIAINNYTGMSLSKEGATYGPRATSGPRRLIFLALTLPFWLKCGPRDINKGAMWPADENSRPPLVYRNAGTY